MKQFCPISPAQINEHIARTNAIMSVLLTIIAFTTPLKWFMYILASDFFIRGFIDSRYSPLFQLSKKLNQLLNIKPKRINAGPKIFAAQVGFIFTLVVSIAFLLDLTIISHLFGGIFVFCAFMEAAFAFCIACQLYPLLRTV